MADTAPIKVETLIGEVCRFELYGGDIIKGRVEAYADGMLFIMGKNEIEINGIKNLEVLK